MHSTIVALSIHHLANGDPDTGKAYDSHTSVLNAARKASAYLWEGEPGCETAGLNITSNPGVKEFCARARKAALGARGGKVGEDSSAVGTPLRGSGKRKGVVEEGASEVSPPKRGASAKKRKVDLLPSSSTAAAAGGSGKKAAVPMPVKRGVGRPRKIVVDSPAPPVPKRSNRKKVAPPPSSSSSSDSSSDSSSSDSSDSDSDSPPPPPPKRSYKRKVGTASPAKPKPIVAKPKPAPVLSKGNLAKLEGRKGRATRRSEAQKKEDDLSTLTSLDTEEEAAMEIDQAEEERPTGVGMFGKIVRWFGFRAK